MNIEIESSVPEQRSFEELCQKLVGQNRKFDTYTLKQVPYSQLHLCCIGNAGAASCPPHLVQQEKLSRRERFLHMEPDEFKEAEIFLKIERMYVDVMHAIAMRSAPEWNALSSLQKLWVKITCLYNHVDNPDQRIAETIRIFEQGVSDPYSLSLPAEICVAYGSKLKGIASVYPGRLSDDVFRSKLSEIAEILLEFMPDLDRKVIEKEQIRGFSCTSDCFKIM